MANRHTPGTWECFLQVRNRRTGGMDAILATSSGVVLATVRDAQDAERLANARLMAAAPELLEIAREVARFGNIFRYRIGEKSLYERATEAIARVEGMDK